MLRGSEIPEVCRAHNAHPLALLFGPHQTLTHEGTYECAKEDLGE